MDDDTPISLAQLLSSGAFNREIPGEDECKRRFKLVISFQRGGNIEKMSVDAVPIDTDGLLLVWKWDRRSGQDIPAPWSPFLPLGQRYITKKDSVSELSRPQIVVLPPEAISLL